MALTTAAPAQTRKALQRSADEAFAAANYPLALHYYGEALAIAPTESALQYGYGLSAYRSRAYQAAADQLTPLTRAPVAYPLALFYAARAHQVLGDLPRAESLYTTFVTDHGSYPEAAFAREQLALLPDVKRLLAQPDAAAAVTHLGRSVNSAYSEFAPYPRGDTLLYSSFRYPVKTERGGEERITKVLHRTSAGGRGRPVGRGFNVAGRHTAHPQLSPDGRRYYFTVCDQVAGQIRCQLAYRTRDRRGKWRAVFELVEAPINQPGTTTTQPHITVDSAGRTVLHFVSDRSGGAGGLDIYRSYWKGEDWGKPTPISGVNTAADELSPHYDVAEGLLYFATNGRPGLGGIDIFAQQLSTRAVALLGAPINSTYDDLYYVPVPGAERAYLASNRPEAYFLDKNNKSCCYDLFEVTAPRSPFAPPPPVAPAPPVAITDQPLPPPVRPPTPTPAVPSRPTTLAGFLPLALYFDNDHPDPRTRRTSTQLRYADTYDRYLRQQSTYARAYAADVDPERQFALEREIDDFFTADVRAGYRDLELFSDILLDRLQRGDRVEIFVKGYTSPRARGDYNLRLGQRRVSSVRNEFEAIHGGVFRPFLTNGQLVITEVSFGETRAATGVSDALDDRRNSVYSPAAARERRVEIVEVR